MRKIIFGGLACLFIILSCLALTFERHPKQAQQTMTRNLMEIPSAMPPPAMVTDDATPPRAPGIDPAAAPGVAFNYQYAFRLPSNRIAEMQETHAAACEKLTARRCRITGMRYSLTGDRDVSAMLAVKLDPAISRQFGKDAAAAITGADGTLIESQISGVDAEAAIAAADRDAAGFRTEIDRLESDLRRPGQSPAERERLTSALARARTALDRASRDQDDGRESLAVTPMTFTYVSGMPLPEPDRPGTLGDSFATAGSTLVKTVGMLIVIGSALVPWALLLLLGWLAWRGLRPHVRRWRMPVEPPAEAAIPG